MKKITLTLALMLALHSCKKESKEIPADQPQTEQAEATKGHVQTPVSPVVNPNAIVPPGFYETHGLYDGVGIVSVDGVMNYNILMPLLKSGSYNFVRFYNLGNNVLFMQMQDPDFQPLNENTLYTLREDILPLGFNPKEDINVYLYFENGAPLTETQAKRIFVKGCTSMSEPKKCGTGILKFAEE